MTINDIEIIPIGKAKNKIGQKFGRLTVLGRAKPDNPNRRQAYWWCECDCGNIIKVRGDSLHGNTLSCGYYKKDVNKEQGKELARKYNSINGPKNKKDLVGQRFFHLLVTKDSGQRQKTGNGTQVIWECLCDCGNITYVPTGHLQSGHTTSCGCRKMSKGEEAISSLLSKNNIDFIPEYRDSNCKLSTGGVARFDFYIQNKYYIEYDGEQHFDCENHGWNNIDGFLKTQLRDKEKNIYCLNNNIPLIRIPYTHYKNICVEDLIPETSKFLITREDI